MYLTVPQWFQILVFVLLFTAVLCQQDEDDGSYNPEKYEKPYENLVDENSSGEQSFTNQLPAGFQQPQQVQQTQPQQPPTFYQQQQNVLPTQQPSAPVQNPFPQNPFFRQLQNSGLQTPQQQYPSFQQNIVAQTPSFPQQNAIPQFQQRTPLQLPQSPAFNSFRQPAPVNQFLDEGAPLQSTNYQTDDGHQRSEVVDDNGNVQGQYSYVDPNGKTITVKYSAGKDGFRVEGDHIPGANQQQADQPQPQQPSLFTQPQVGAPENVNGIQFRPQQPRFSNPPQQQFFNPVQPRSQFNSFQPQFQVAPRQQFSQQPAQINQQSPFSFQPDGGYEFQSNFQ